jgi:hypothetical protein
MVTKKHPHAETLAEASQDITRKIMGMHIHADHPQEVTLSAVAGSNSDWVFYFADTVNKPMFVSSLTDEELFAIAAEHAHRNEDINCEVNRAVANVAAQRAVEELPEVIANYLKDINQL